MKPRSSNVLKSSFRNHPIAFTAIVVTVLCLVAVETDDWYPESPSRIWVMLGLGVLSLLFWFPGQMKADRRRKLRVGGRCGECGYDLRASPDRCPECGTAVSR